MPQTQPAAEFSYACAFEDGLLRVSGLEQGGRISIPPGAGSIVSFYRADGQSFTFQKCFVGTGVIQTGNGTYQICSSFALDVQDGEVQVTDNNNFRGIDRNQHNLVLTAQDGGRTQTFMVWLVNETGRPGQD